MNREDAKQALYDGKKLTHMYFTDEGWVKQVGGMYEFEDGCKSTPHQFWLVRSHDSYDKCWSEYHEK